jgi:hypothetical protein
MFTGSIVSGLDLSSNNTWRLSVHHNEEFKKDIEKAEQVILDTSLVFSLQKYLIQFGQYGVYFC